MIAALFVGLLLGGTGYHIFVAPTVRLRAAKLAVLMAAKELRDWLDWAPLELKEQVESSMVLYNFERLVGRLAASDVAAKEGKMLENNTKRANKLTKRELLAAMAMQAIITKNAPTSVIESDGVEDHDLEVARAAVDYADALLMILEDRNL